MKRITANLILLITLVLTATTIASTTATVHADGGDEIFKGVCSASKGAKTKSPLCAKQTGNPIFGADGILIKVALIITVITGIASVIMVIVGGIKIAASRGDASAVANARTTVLYAVIGAVISATAGAIIFYVIGSL